MRGGTYADDMRSAGLGSKHRKDPSTTPNIQHALAFEKMRIVHDGSAIRARANRVLQHLLMDTCASLALRVDRKELYEAYRNVRRSLHSWAVANWESCEEQVKGKMEYGTRGHDDALISGGHARSGCNRC
jgi:hypothetical protein